MSRKVRAKFHCIVVDGGHVELGAVYEDDNEENKEFWEATPSGHIEMYITNDSALDFFEFNETYYVDFVKVGE